MEAKTFDYPEAARAIAVWLKPFCNEDLPYPEMIADAARKASLENSLLQSKIDELKEDLANKEASAPWMQTEKKMPWKNKDGELVIITIDPYKIASLYYANDSDKATVAYYDKLAEEIKPSKSHTPDVDINDDEWETNPDDNCEACGYNHGNHMYGCPNDDSPFAELCRNGYD